MICEGCRTYITYTGKERDAETGLDYFGARYMSSAQGRFTSPDPENAGADLLLPQS
jgi:RHS repeat-associated protein